MYSTPRITFCPVRMVRMVVPIMCGSLRTNPEYLCLQRYSCPQATKPSSQQQCLLALKTLAIPLNPRAGPSWIFALGDYQNLPLELGMSPPKRLVYPGNPALRYTELTMDANYLKMAACQAACGREYPCKPRWATQTFGASCSRNRA